MQSDDASHFCLVSPSLQSTTQPGTVWDNALLLWHTILIKIPFSVSFDQLYNLSFSKRVSTRELLRKFTAV